MLYRATRINFAFDTNTLNQSAHWLMERVREHNIISLPLEL